MEVAALAWTDRTRLRGTIQTLPHPGRSVQLFNTVRVYRINGEVYSPRRPLDKPSKDSIFERKVYFLPL
jgi:hypothetical protein